MSAKSRRSLAMLAAAAALVVAIWLGVSKEGAGADSPTFRRDSRTHSQAAVRQDVDAPRDATRGKVAIRPDREEAAAARLERQRERLTALSIHRDDLKRGGLANAHPTFVAVQREIAEILHWMAEQRAGGMEFPWPAEDLGFDSSRGYVGVTLESPTLQVRSLIPGGPAEKAGILPGDLLLAADGHPLGELSGGEAMEHLQGEPGEPVLLTIQRPDEENVRQVRVVRAPIPAEAAMAPAAPVNPGP